MSTVPLNLGADALRLNPHLEQVVAVSVFEVPQFGQNNGLSSEREFSGTVPLRHSSFLVGLSIRVHCGIILT